MRHAFLAVFLLWARAARAEPVVMEGIPSSADSILVSSLTTQVSIGTNTTYGGPVPNVALFTTSNVVVGISGCVLYSTGSLTCPNLAVSSGAVAYSLTAGSFIGDGSALSGLACSAGAGLLSVNCLGFGNMASALDSAIGGGFLNGATGLYSTVSGGFSNSASGINAAVSGGILNAASGINSFAAGNAANAISSGSFVLSASSPLISIPVYDNGVNSISLYATGGVFIDSGSLSVPTSSVTASAFFGDGSNLTGIAVGGISTGVVTNATLAGNGQSSFPLAVLSVPQSGVNLSTITTTLAGYLPLAGGTMTGELKASAGFNASSATFTSSITVSGALFVGNDLIAIDGSNALLISGVSTVSLGQSSCVTGTGADNTCIGSLAGQVPPSGSDNTYIGWGSADGTSSASSSNTYVGFLSGQGHGVAIGNVAVGFSALENVSTGSTNTVVGNQAAFNVSTGTANIIIGRSAAPDLTTGSGNIIIGNSLKVGSAGISNTLNIGGVLTGANLNAVGTSSVSVQGPSFSVGGSTLTVSNGEVGIGTASPQGTLDVVSTTLGLGIPVLTSTQVEASTPLKAGTLIFNSSLGVVCVSTGTTKEGYSLITSKTTTCQ